MIYPPTGSWSLAGNRRSFAVRTCGVDRAVAIAIAVEKTFFVLTNVHRPPGRSTAANMPGVWAVNGKEAVGSAAGSLLALLSRKGPRANWSLVPPSLMYPVSSIQQYIGWG